MANLFPAELDLGAIITQVEQLAQVLSDVSAERYVSNVFPRFLRGDVTTTAWLIPGGFLDMRSRSASCSRTCGASSDYRARRPRSPPVEVRSRCRQRRTSWSHTGMSKQPVDLAHSRWRSSGSRRGRPTVARSTRALFLPGSRNRFVYTFPFPSCIQEPRALTCLLYRASTTSVSR